MTGVAFTQEWYFTTSDLKGHIQRSKNANNAPHFPSVPCIGPFPTREAALQEAHRKLASLSLVGNQAVYTFRREPHTPVLSLESLSKRLSLIAAEELQAAGVDGPTIDPKTYLPSSDKSLELFRQELQGSLENLLPSLIGSSLRWSTIADWERQEFLITPAEAGFADLGLGDLLLKLGEERRQRNWDDAERIELAITHVAKERISHLRLPFMMKSYVRNPENPWSKSDQEKRLHILIKKDWAGTRIIRGKHSALCHTASIPKQRWSEQHARICLPCFTRLARELQTILETK